MGRKNYPRETHGTHRKVTAVYINRPYLRRLGFTDWQIDDIAAGDEEQYQRRVKAGVNIRK